MSRERPIWVVIDKDGWPWHWISFYRVARAEWARMNRMYENQRPWRLVKYMPAQPRRRRATDRGSKRA